MAGAETPRRPAFARLRHHGHRRRLRGFGYFKRIGPGLVTGASDDDPSGIGTYSQAGAAFGFGLLWTAIISAEIFVPYHTYAKVLRWLTLSLVSYVAVLLAVHVEWGQVVRRTFVPHLHSNRSFLAALIAVFGTTISPYLFFWQASEEVE